MTSPKVKDYLKKCNSCGVFLICKCSSLLIMFEVVMNKKSSIPVYELKYDNEKVAFAIHSNKEVIAMFGDTADRPRRLNYYTVLWSPNFVDNILLTTKKLK